MNKEKTLRWSLNLGAILVAVGVIGLAALKGSEGEEGKKYKKILMVSLGVGILLVGASIIFSNTQAETA